jgi:phage terminase large subunit-like protein
MVRLSRPLAKRLTVVPSTARIIDESTGSFYTTVAGDAPGALGFDPSGAYIDELLTQPDRELYDAIRTGFGARAQPLLLLATTAENDPAGFAATEREWSLKVKADPELEPDRLPVIYTTKAEEDWTNPEIWRKANPALGDFLEMRTLQSECRSALGNPAGERAFRQYRLNQPTRQVGRAINMVTWQNAPAIERSLEGRSCYAGMDLASTQDLAAYVLDFPDDDNGHDILWRHFAPEAKLPDLDRRTGRRASVWASQGLLTITPGDAIDHRAIRSALIADAARYDILEVGFDVWGSAMLANELTEDGFNLIQISQGYTGMSNGTTELLRLVGSKAYRHGNNPVADWQASNLVVSTDPAGHLRPSKDKSAEKIDGIVAGIMALDRACRHITPPADWTGNVMVL